MSAPCSAARIGNGCVETRHEFRVRDSRRNGERQLHFASKARIAAEGKRSTIVRACAGREAPALEHARTLAKGLAGQTQSEIERGHQ